MKYHREEELKSRLNNFFITQFSLPEDDYYSRLDSDKIISLKMALSDINNLLTMKITISFVNWISKKFHLSQESKQKLTDEILSIKPSTNGYDLVSNEIIKLIAEVKCNIPINGGTKYGSAQRNGITKDLNNLLYGKTKSKFNTTEYFKFMVFLENQSVRAANQHYINLSKELKENLIIVDETTSFDRKDCIYLIYINF
ncbi:MULTISPECIES: hypothetical protein [Acinetobacter]|jgi:hypothetical protein|uniref:Uncharacterized protein n=1 Tax=Acinetobacter johnsonii TaxID=40214 RepID=A0AAJ6LAK8_ACIJO|nr:MULTISPECIES: hypothetical protein [Acinetobacter]ALV72124.1 hypothetical protein RZ95_03890 [Acinetobacter johnsonii XBB1]MBK5647574.1 hypothetical protein [Acinetobacter sp.]MCV2450885.1 hypothetical protein [Acinetobacter johnsonii]MDG9785569.1 hypothetical protein [Acinetobacter johnsonii]MDG9799910.1 hypothetical protein [Acinetobacter johnsonii]